MVTDGAGIKFVASSASVGNVVEGWRTMIGFEVFFCRIWYFLSPEERIAYPGVVAVAGEEVIVILLMPLALLWDDSGEKTNAGGLSDSRRAKISAGSSRSLKAC